VARNRKRPRGTGANRTGAGGRTPGPLESGETQLTEVQAGLGRPDLGEVPSEEQLTAFEEGANGNGTTSSGPVEGAPVIRTRSGGGGHGGNGGSVAAGDDDHGHGRGVERAPNILERLIGFLLGSYRELGRVQWPDRRQVFQATGVVIGFVIVAGAFLGVASFAAQKIVNLILYGHG
jgi:preprotein translocase subunit SecE